MLMTDSSEHPLVIHTGWDMRISVTLIVAALGLGATLACAGAGIMAYRLNECAKAAHE